MLWPGLCCSLPFVFPTPGLTQRVNHRLSRGPLGRIDPRCSLLSPDNVCSWHRAARPGSSLHFQPAETARDPAVLLRTDIKHSCLPWREGLQLVEPKGQHQKRRDAAEATGAGSSERSPGSTGP